MVCRLFHALVLFKWLILFIRLILMLARTTLISISNSSVIDDIVMVLLMLVLFFISNMSTDGWFWFLINAAKRVDVLCCPLIFGVYMFGLVLLIV